jgi:hypothetical protein
VVGLTIDGTEFVYFLLSVLLTLVLYKCICGRTCVLNEYCDYIRNYTFAGDLR